MTYTVAYKPSADRELVELWMHGPDRSAVAAAANRIDRLLGTDPHNQGESRDGTRIMFERPLAVQFEISDDDRLVQVLKVWWIGE